MNKKETAQIIAILKEYYPRDFESTNIQTKVEAWYLALKDYEYTVAQKAVIAFATSDTKGFAPVVGQIIHKIKSFYPQTREITESEAWDMVYKAICNSNYNAAEEFNRLPKRVQRAVGSSEMLKSWAMLGIDEVNTVIQSNVMRSFKVAQAQEKEFEALPQAIKEFTNQTLMLAEKFKI